MKNRTHPIDQYPCHRHGCETCTWLRREEQDIRQMDGQQEARTLTQSDRNATPAWVLDQDE